MALLYKKKKFSATKETVKLVAVQRKKPWLIHSWCGQRKAHLFVSSCLIFNKSHVWAQVIYEDTYLDNAPFLVLDGDREAEHNVWRSAIAAVTEDSHRGVVPRLGALPQAPHVITCCLSRRKGWGHFTGCYHSCPSGLHCLEPKTRWELVQT